MRGTFIADRPWLVPTLILFLACLRLCHSGVLWADEDYHLAAAVHILNGKVPYRDFWYDKPPLNSLYYVLIGGREGWPLRLLDAGYVVAACYLAYALARDWWGELEGRVAALFLAFYTTFYLPSAVVSFAADALMIVPHLAAVLFVRRRMLVAAGVAAGLAFLVNVKAAFVLAACVVFLWPDLMLVGLARLAIGFAAPLVLGLAWAVITGAWMGYLQQVWEWGLIYSRGSPVAHPVSLGVVRTVNWVGFHSALVACSVFAFLRIRRDDQLKLGAWITLSFAAVCLGTRFAPHYYLQLLPPLVIAASGGIVLAARQYKVAPVLIAALLLVPVVRFAPRYAMLAIDGIEHQEPHWSDIAMDIDSKHAAEKLSQRAQPGDTLLVWGYRPDLYVYTRLSPDGIFWDSQPLTGVPADRHLSATGAIYGGPAKMNRQELVRSRPTFIVDGLTPFNPRLSPGVYSELRPWLEQYKLVDRTPLCLIYERQK